MYFKPENVQSSNWRPGVGHHSRSYIGPYFDAGLGPQSKNNARNPIPDSHNAVCCGLGMCSAQLLCQLRQMRFKACVVDTGSADGGRLHHHTHVVRHTNGLAGPRELHGVTVAQRLLLLLAPLLRAKSHVTHHGEDL
eukprot:217301-Chlamydomonas_euryale.AAC.1